MNREELVEIVTRAVLEKLQQKAQEPLELSKQVPLGISNRHVHLSANDFAKLFGPGAKLTKWKDLSQPGQYACQEKVTLIGPKGVIEQVRVLGPIRQMTQVEVSVTDCFKLGIKPVIRDSGDLEGSSGITLAGPAGVIALEEGCIVAARHIHMTPQDAKKYGLRDKDKVCVQSSGVRSVVFNNVLVRVHENYRLELHLDFDEANGAYLKCGDMLDIVKC